MKKPKDWRKRAMDKVPYYRVGPCPRCGSKVTGRYIQRSPFDFGRSDRDIIRDCLDRGQHVRIGRRGSGNAYCGSCGHAWTEYISLSFISEETFEKELSDRRIERSRKEDLSPRPGKKSGLFRKIITGLTGLRF